MWDEAVMKKVDIISITRLTDGFAKIDRLVLRHQLHNGGISIPFQREVLRRPPAVGVILYDPVADACVMIEQFRPGPWLAGHPAWTLEIVAGMIEPGEDPATVARREALEEAGVVIEDLTYLFGYFPSGGASSEYLRLYVARVDSTHLGGIFGVVEEGEDIKVCVLPLTDLQQRLQNGQLDQAVSIIAVQWLLLNRDAMRQQWASRD